MADRVTPEEIRRIREAAEGADTPGPWTTAAGGEIVESETASHPYAAGGSPLEVASELQRGDARHIATSDPSTVLRLVEEIGRLRAEVAAGRDRCAGVVETYARAFPDDPGTADALTCAARQVRKDGGCGCVGICTCGAWPYP